MTADEHPSLAQLELEDRHWTIRERLLSTAILAIGIILALFIYYVIDAGQDDITTIRCEEGEVTLVLERAGGIIETVECPVSVAVTP